MLSATASGTTLPFVDTIPPTAQIVSPGANTVVTGTVTVTVNATDNLAMARVMYYVDQVYQGTDSEAPYAFAWNTALVSTGTHTLKATAFDTSGNGTASLPVTVMVSRSVGLGATNANLPPWQGAGEDPLAFGKVYAYPHPVVHGEGTTLHVEAGSADRVTVRVQRLNGEILFEAEATQTVRTSDGKWAREIRWNTAGLPSGTYAWLIEASKGGEKIRMSKRLTVIR